MKIKKKRKRKENKVPLMSCFSNKVPLILFP
jgi:hypothetical protein